MSISGSVKLQQDILWNIVSLIVMGISGILMNILIGFYYNAAVLGIFNQVYSVYIIFSQFAAGGFHLSTVKYVAEYAADREKSATIIAASICSVFALSFVVSICFWLSKESIGAALDSPGVVKGIYWATPGLFFFAINKVFLAVINGFRRMKLYAALQAFRFVMMIVSLIAGILVSCPGENLPIVFSATEMFLFIALLIVVKKHIYPASVDGMQEWMVRHCEFGIKSFLSGALVELNTRVDVLMLGYFAGDKIVGIYSFAAMLTEGICQILVVFRTNFNPILVKLIAENKLDELKAMVKKGKAITYAIIFIIGAITTALYPVVIKMVINKPIFIQSWPVFAILMSGIVLSAGYIPFRQILITAGYPGMHTIMISMLVGFNIIANLVFIPIWEAPGAAFATALSFVFYIFLIKYLTRIKVGIMI